jgi:prepilin-type N-terminal cleavage/methylation domain-containing protein
MNKKAFTLVELIVVITILAVLATVAFISFQWYTLSARDSARLWDISSIEKILHIYKVRHDQYPEPDKQTNITYSGSVAWTQWVFGKWSYSDGASMSNIPVDPLTDIEYAYSVTANRIEYQLAWVLENQVVSHLTPSTFAWDQEAEAYVRWNYNGKFLKVRTDTTTYLLWVPSIIASDITSVDLETILTNNRLVYKGYKNLPASFSGGVYNTSPVNWFDFIPWKVVLFEWDIKDLENSQVERVTFLENLQTNYTNTEIATESDISELLSIDSSSPSESSKYVAIALNNSLKTSIAIVAVESSESTPITWWRALDSNCDIDDITIGSQVWAWCNSTLWTGFEWGKKDDGSNGTVISCYNYEWSNNATCTIWDTTMASNTKANTWYTGTNTNWDTEVGNIWWKLYTWGNKDSACATWYHVPSDGEWETLETTLNGWTNCRNATDWWQCIGLWWNGHDAKHHQIIWFKR